MNNYKTDFRWLKNVFLPILNDIKGISNFEEDKKIYK